MTTRVHLLEHAASACLSETTKCSLNFLEIVHTQCRRQVNEYAVGDTK